MKDFDFEGNYYTLNHVAICTGLSNRTLRNYLNMGLLKGEKINGIWHFSPEQVEDFISSPTVRPSILAKNNAHVFDFLHDRKKEQERMVVALDLPNKNRKAVSEFFCYKINNGNFSNITFSMDAPPKGYPRIILCGKPLDVLSLLNEFYAL